MAAYVSRNVTNVSIGIQARSGSTRFPSKILESVNGKRVIDHVIDACQGSCDYMNRYTSKSGIFCTPYLLVPDNDPLKNLIKDIEVIEGSEDDVLERYVKMSKECESDYIVRITADCPMIPEFIISKAITIAVKNNLDYCSNVDEKVRTSIDGHDVEVISQRALEWLDTNAVEEKHREHVTLMLRQVSLPHDFKVGFIIGYVDHSNIKLSLDTPDDLLNIREESEKIRDKIKIAESIYGRKSVHRV